MYRRALPLPAVLLSTLSLGVHAQSTLEASTTGKILDATPKAYQSATSHAGLTNNQAIMSTRMRFVDPTSPLFMHWGSGVRVDSLGSLGESCEVQRPLPPKDPVGGRPFWHCVTYRSDNPPWHPGSGADAAGAGGTFRHESGASLPAPRNPREVRFRAIDHSGASLAYNGSSGYTRLDQGRTATQATLRFAPPWPLDRTKPACTADLVLELNYGIDGRHDPDPNHAVVADRWLDLDITYAVPFGLPGHPRGKITVRAAGQPKQAPRGSGWPERFEEAGIQQSTIHVDTSTGSQPPLTFSWNNGVVAPAKVPFTQVFDTWARQTVRVPLTLPTPMEFRLDVLTHQRQSLGRAIAGISSVPFHGNPAAKGHGLDVRMYLDNIQPARCRPDHTPPRRPFG